ncbi:hypothetical protein CC2G_009185 [Coprinopsis cinerea AmutBmut pab1-1]|nr:hypothetical protein CC2G_009185 [Coprinopsis cinerea AmutBmut pab1-1]
MFNIHEGARLAQTFGRFCQALMRRKFNRKTVVEPPPNLSSHLQSEALQIVNIVKMVFASPHYT